MFCTDIYHPITIKGEEGFLTSTLDFVAEPRFTVRGGFINGLALVSREGKYGYINKNGEVEIPIIYDYAHAFGDVIAEVVIDGKYGVINRKGEFVIRPVWDELAFETFSTAIRVVRDGLTGWILLTGETVIPFQKIKCKGMFDENQMCLVWRDESWVFIDTCGDVRLLLGYPEVEPFSNGLAAVRNHEGCVGYIYYVGDLVIPCIYEEGRSCAEGFCPVRTDKKWGMVYVSSGEVAIAFSFDELEPFQEGLSLAKKEGKWGCLSHGGKWTVPCMFQNKPNCDERFVRVCDYDKDRTTVSFYSWSDFTRPVRTFDL